MPDAPEYITQAQGIFARYKTWIMTACAVLVLFVGGCAIHKGYVAAKNAFCGTGNESGTTSDWW